MKNKRKSGLKWILAVWFCGISAMADAQVTEGLKAIGMENIRCAQTPAMTTVSFENNVYRSTYTGVGKAIDADKFTLEDMEKYAAAIGCGIEIEITEPPEGGADPHIK